MLSPRALVPAFLFLSLPLMAEELGDSLKWNFQARMRGELRNNVYDFDSDAKALTDDSWLLHRFRLGVEWQPLEWLRFTVQGQDVRESFSDRPDVPLLNGAEGDDAFDLRLASIEFGNANKLSLKLGRQVLAYGDERLVGPLEWLNFSRTFDAVKFHLEHEGWWLDAFTSSVVRYHESEFNRSDWLGNSDGTGQFFSGIYYSNTSVLRFQTTDLYAFHLHQESSSGGSDFITLGTRWKGDPLLLDGWDYTAEFAGQSGRVRGKELGAYAHHLEAGYNWLKQSWKPRIAMEYSFGTGDDNAADGNVHTFQNLFPTNHPPYGFMDTFSWQNMHNVAFRLAAQPHPKFKAALDLHSFWLSTSNDAWYRANGITQVRDIQPGASRHAGYELDLTLNAKLSQRLDLLLGYSHFFAGDYLADTGASSDADFAYLTLTFNY
ncbi:MAG: alginate export family protein [Verrucomicrobiaceae bacterium]|nr:alginate export family protein [Verrucomicrobiaceae bacterium]